MRLIKIIIIVVLVAILILITLTILTSRGFSEITDLIHRDTEEVHVEEGYSFTNPKLEQYQINGILFIPYTRQNPFKTYEDKYYNYSLRIASYRQTGDAKVIINHVAVEEVNNVKFNKITKELNKELEFSNDEENGIQMSEIILIDEINDYNMELTDKSQIKVVLNVSVEENGKTTTRDLEYIFGTRIRKYLNQP